MRESALARVASKRQAIYKAQEFWLACVLVLFVVGLSILRPNFISLQNILDLLSSYAYMGILVSALLFLLPLLLPWRNMSPSHSPIIMMS